MKKIAIITGQHLVSNPRVWKEANFLSSVGYSVSIFSIWYDRRLIQKDIALISESIRYYAGFSLLISWRRILIVIISKLGRKFANLIFLLLKKPSIYQIVYSPRTQLRNITKQHFDLFICHQEQGLLLGVELLKKGDKVAFDLEDWYSQDYLKLDRPVKLLQDAELYAIHNGTYLTCPSKAMATKICDYYNVKMDIEVIYNSFPFSPGKKIEVEKIPNSFVWFSQHLGPDRGIEPFLIAMKLIRHPLQIHLIGQCEATYKLTLEKIVSNTSHQLVFHPLLSHYELMQFISKFEIGLALEQNYPLNRNLTVTNKLLTYLQMGLRVIASNTLGQLELKDDLGDNIAYVDLSNSIDIAQKVEETIFSTNRSISQKLYNNYSWEEQAKKIQLLVEKSIYN